MKRILFFTVLAGVLAWGKAEAHEFFIRPGRTAVYRTGDTVDLGLYSSHSFTAGESMGPPERNEVYVLQGTRNIPLALSANEGLKIFQMQYRLDGGALAVAVAHRKPSFSCATTEGSKRGTRSEVESQGFTVVTSTLSESWCTFYINPSSGDRTFSAPRNLRLEIVPVTNPADLRAGRSAAFRVLYTGRPLAGCDLAYAGENEEGFTSTVKTDDSGNAVLTPNAAGLLFVRVGFVAPVSGQADYDRESVTSIAVFSVAR
ncbi:MAG: DUF4198 domain-containing protein [Spirochaetales bacterium]|nr:DUF4198 domain-containing protein [Spirochaetales bacterium]